jgi:regulator of protease activity HflC (stomatin/prohibitin superfamily)
MKLTPSGYENQIYTPGQVDLGRDDNNGQMNKLVLIQRSGVEVKEQFLGKNGSEDKEDHRCLLGDKSPLTLDVRLLLALPDYEKPEGKKELNRLFLLGNPVVVAETSSRVLRISAESVYNDQARQLVRGRLRQLCANYKDFDTIFASLADASEKGFTKQIEHEIAGILKLQNVPLSLVSAFPSNIKPDDSIIEATAAQMAADKRVVAIKKITDFLDADKTGSRVLVYRMQVLQEIVNRAETNGHNTVVLSTGSEGPTSLIPIVNNKTITQVVKEKPEDAAKK